MKKLFIIPIDGEKSDKFLLALTQDLVGAGYRILGLDSKQTANGKVTTSAKIEVDSYKAKCKFSTKEFRCREKDFRGVEFVDMR